MAEIQARPFGPQFSEAISFLKGKLPEASLAWDSLAGPVHSKVFTVAGAASADLARDINKSLTQALASGTTITQFRKDFDKVVQDYGWTYKGKRGWRTSVIFDNNMRSAHMAGRWSQLQANKDRRPYLQYRTAGDAKVRPQHRQWNGLIYPIDDPFWQIHYPPNGWGCRCTVRAYSLADLGAKGLQVAEPYKVQMRNVVNRDGEITDRVPLGIDPGWDHNVGMSWIAPELALGAKLARLPPELRGLLVDKTISPAFQTVLNGRWTAFQTQVQAAGTATGDAQVVGYLDSATLNGLAEIQPLRSSAIAASDTMALAKQPWPATWLADLPANLRNYQAVLWDQVDQVLVIVPQGKLPGSRLATATLRLNQRTRYGTALTVDTLGAATAANLADADRYRLLVGSLK
ncbi:phage head morphogenesis protein [Paucibacter sp. O1-1]|nr:phage head morphogenesis protein [Paucibacter sp. O1-1]MDA3826599.1 phage head morphogenesis protein [Paucibacter sp. O1-1]